MFIFLTFPGTSMTKLALPWLSDVSSKFTLSFLLAVFPMLILLPECVVPVTEMDIGIPRAGVLSGYFRSTCQCRQEIEVMFLKWNKFFLCSFRFSLCSALDVCALVHDVVTALRLIKFKVWYIIKSNFCNILKNCKSFSLPWLGKEAQVWRTQWSLCDQSWRETWRSKFHCLSHFLSFQKFSRWPRPRSGVADHPGTTEDQEWS